MKLAKFTFTITLSLISISAFAELNIPRVINFQSVLRDDAGNLIATDTTSLEFRILDADGTQLYFESQAEVPVTRGAVNAMIGEGNIPGTSTPTGGIPLNALDPTTGEKLLQYRIGSGEPVDPIELSLIPYAFWSEKSLGVVNNSIGSDQIRNGSIKLEDLEAGTISFNDVSGMIGVTQIPPSIARHSEITNHETSPTAHQASSIIVQGPLPRLPAAVNNVQNALTEFASLLSNEISQRQTTRDTFTESLRTLTTNLSNEAATRAGADSVLTTDINSRVNKNGDVMSGNLNFDDAACSPVDGTPTCLVDGVDVSHLQERVIALGGRVTNLSQLQGMVSEIQVPQSMRPLALATLDTMDRLAVTYTPNSRMNISHVTRDEYHTCALTPATPEGGMILTYFFQIAPEDTHYIVNPVSIGTPGIHASVISKSNDRFVICAPSPRIDVAVFKP